MIKLTSAGKWFAAVLLLTVLGAFCAVYILVHPVPIPPKIPPPLLCDKCSGKGRQVQTCPTCSGKGSVAHTIPCPTCGLTGKIGAFFKNKCPRCSDSSPIGPGGLSFVKFELRSSRKSEKGSSWKFEKGSVSLEPIKFGWGILQELKECEQCRGFKSIEQDCTECAGSGQLRPTL